MSMERSDVEWDLGSDEIASVASDELYDNRPNRWKGPRSTWRTLTEQERLYWQSLKQIRDQDLSVHLYNTFALKRHGRNPKTAQDLLVQTEDGQEAVWAPPKIWTAWPLGERHLPQVGLMARTDDQDEQFTFRKQEKQMPSTELEEELGAIILGQAKDRFLKRQSRFAAPLPSIETATPLGDQGYSSQQLPALLSSAPSSPAAASEEDDQEIVLGEGHMPQGATQANSGCDFDPVVSANDDVSYRLLRPSIRHILSQLDQTLTILHNSRLAGLGYLSDSTTEDESDNGPARKRPRGRPRTAWEPSGTTSPESHSAPPRTSRRGRPRKIHTPKEGESHEDMMTRIARESHRRLPLLEKDKEAMFLEWMQRGEEEPPRPVSREATPQQPGEGAEITDEEDAGTLNVEKKLARWGLRDWSDVVGAAALAGFPRDVIARTTRRCANLFGEGMVIRHLDEVPAARGTGIADADYRPEPIRLSPADAESDDSDADGARTLRQRRLASRRASLARSSQGSESGSPAFRGRAGRSSGNPASRSQSRSRSRSRSAATQFFCPVPSCDRAASGFLRRANLARHVQLVHGGDSGGGVTDTDGDADGDDEGEDFVGAVHVDGFLKPIVPGRGWRGEDTMVRKRKSYYADRRLEGRSPRSRRTSADEEDSH